MNAAEAAELLAHAGLFDNRKPSLAASKAWAAALPDFPADDDAKLAIARFYGTPPKKEGERLWIQPHDVRRIRQEIRDERLTDFQYEPQPGDDDPRTYLANLQAQRAAVASGLRPAVVRRPELPAGPRRMVNVAAIGRAVPAADGDPRVDAGVDRRGRLGVECPTCGALVGRPCKAGRGGVREPHVARRRVADGQPAVDPGQQAEAEARRAAAAAALAQLSPEERARLEEFRAEMGGAA